jgi:hypothetical protein
LSAVRVAREEASPAGRFVPAGSVLIDAGRGDSNQIDGFGNFPVEVLNVQT